MIFTVLGFGAIPIKSLHDYAHNKSVYCKIVVLATYRNSKILLFFAAQSGPKFIV